MGRRERATHQMSALCGGGPVSLMCDFLSLHNPVYIIFVHKLQKGFFSSKFLANSDNLNYIIKRPVYVNHLINCLPCS